jgi:hypothetical protein
MYRIGTASTVITPNEPMWLAGYAVRTRPSSGTLSDLHAKALALEDANGERFVLITVDLIAISREIASTVAAHALQAHGLPRERLLFSASHTHYGPEIRPDKAEFFKIPHEFAEKIEPYGRWLTQASIGLVDRALDSLQPVQLIARQTKAAFASNRRPVNHGVDHDVPLLGARDGAGNLRAVVLSYACHNTSLDPMDGQYSGDWAGFAQAQLEEQHPGATALFVTGAAADQNPDPRYQVELSHRYGAQLADAVQTSLTGDGIAIEGSLAVAYTEVPLPYEPLPSKAQLEANLATDDEPLKMKSRYLLRAMSEGRAFPPTYPCPVHVVRLGRQLLIVAIGGEPVIDYAHMIKREFAGVAPIVWVAGYCNDMFGYVPTRAVLAEGGYEGGRSVLWSALPMPFAAETEDRVMDTVRGLIEKVRSWVYETAAKEDPVDVRCHWGVGPGRDAGRRGPAGRGAGVERAAGGDEGDPRHVQRRRGLRVARRPQARPAGEPGAAPAARRAAVLLRLDEQRDERPQGRRRDLHRLRPRRGPARARGRADAREPLRPHPRRLEV